MAAAVNVPVYYDKLKIIILTRVGLTVQGEGGWMCWVSFRVTLSPCPLLTGLLYLESLSSGQRLRDKVSADRGFKMTKHFPRQPIKIWIMC